MTRNEIANQLTDLFRRYAMAGSPRPIRLTEPLGELGIDSLRLIEFTLAFEKRFGLELPDNFWGQSRALTLQDFLVIVLLEQMNRAPFADQGDTDTCADPDMKRGRRRGAIGIITRKGIARVYERAIYYILSFDLKNQPLPQAEISGLVFRELTHADSFLAEDLWPPDERRRKMIRFRQRLENDFIGIGAWRDGVLVGIDWLTGDSDFEPMTGLRIKVSPGGCYGLDLHERAGTGLQGVGLATLIHSLAVAKERGFRAQYAIVSAQNKRMLAAAVQLLGFQNVGEIRTTLLFQRPSSRWRIGRRSGRSETLVLGD